MDMNTNAPRDYQAFNTGNLDLLEVFKMTYEQSQALAEEYAQSDDPNKKELAEVLRSLEPDFFDLSRGEKMLREFGELLQSQNVPDDKMLEIIGSMIQVATNDATNQIVAMMDENTRGKWDEAMRHSPNIYQVMVLLNHIAKQLGNTTFDDIYDNSVASIVTQVSSMLVKQDQQVNELLSKIPEGYLQEIEDLFDAGQYERAIVLIYQYSNYGK